MTILHIYQNSAYYEIEVTDYNPGNNAITHLLPENCCPSEDPEIEFKVISVTPDDDYFDKGFIPEDDDGFIGQALEAMQAYKVAEFEDGE